jgi:hypothetical protein
LTAKGLSEEYNNKGENTTARIKMHPMGPIKYLESGVLALGLILSISA